MIKTIFSTASVALFASFCCLSVSADENTNAQTGVKSEWLIEGMTCGGCAAGMEGSLTTMDGMNFCKVSYEDETMLCFTDNSKLSIDNIPGLVTSNGFKTVPKTEKSTIDKE